MMSITRISPGPRMSAIVIHHDTVYLAGQVALDSPGESVTAQTTNALERIDSLLEQAGTSKSNILSATIWITDMGTFDEMNAVWDAWIDPENPPARACVESNLAAPQFAVEIGIIAAK